MNSYEIIKQLRIKAGLSQEELARAAGYSDRSTIAKIEAGKIDLTESKITLFAKIFGVTPAYIMGLEGPTPAKSEETIPEDMPEIIMVARAGRKMTQQNREDMIKILRIAFPDAFSEDD